MQDKNSGFRKLIWLKKLKNCSLSYKYGRTNGPAWNRLWRGLSNLCVCVILIGLNADLAVGSPTVASKAAKPTVKIQPTVITAWTHEDSDSFEFAALKMAAEKFNRHQDVYRVVITSALGRDYQSWVDLEGSNGTLPCLLEFDGPLLAKFAWLQYLRPIDQFVSPELLSDFLPSIVAQGTYRGRLYSLGQYESGMGLWGNRRYLLAAGVRIPTLTSPWSLAEFEDALAKLTALENVDYAINFSLYARNSEFYAYAYAPILQGFGGDLIDRRTYRTAKGVLDGHQSVTAMKYFQRWIEKGWSRVVFDRDNDFQMGKTALSWMGNWGYRFYHQALGKDLILLPLPDFGQGIKTGMGSWSWGISSTCHAPAGAWAFLAQLLSTKEIAHMTNVNHAMPARRSALKQSPLYGPQGPLRFFVYQLGIGGMPRPATPAYGTISKTFAEAISNIVTGADVQSELSKAAETIDQAIAARRGYP